MSDVVRTYFFGREEDTLLDDRNIHFWRALAGHIQADRGVRKSATLLDIGCHRGGLLALLYKRFTPHRLIGLEPLTSARRVAAQRLASLPAEVQLFDADGWSEIADASVDLVVGHQDLQCIGDV